MREWSLSVPDSKNRTVSLCVWRQERSRSEFLFGSRNASALRQPPTVLSTAPAQTASCPGEAPSPGHAGSAVVTVPAAVGMGRQGPAAAVGP
jgi:hypothetical protein